MMTYFGHFVISTGSWLLTEDLWCAISQATCCTVALTSSSQTGFATRPRVTLIKNKENRKEAKDRRKKLLDFFLKAGTYWKPCLFMCRYVRRLACIESYMGKLIPDNALIYRNLMPAWGFKMRGDSLPGETLDRGARRYTRFHPQRKESGYRERETGR